MKLTVHHPDVVVVAHLKDLRAKLVLSASKEGLPTVVVDGEGFRSIGQASEAEMC
jgi:hypothetical protein